MDEKPDDVVDFKDEDKSFIKVILETLYKQVVGRTKRLRRRKGTWISLFGMAVLILSIGHSDWRVYGDITVSFVSLIVAISGLFIIIFNS